MENCNLRVYKILGWATGEPTCLHFSLKSHFIVKANKIHSYLGLNFCFSRTGPCHPVILTANGFLFILKENFDFTLQFLSLSLRKTKTGNWREVLMPRPWRSAASCLCKWFSIGCSGMPTWPLHGLSKGNVPIWDRRQRIDSGIWKNSGEKEKLVDWTWSQTRPCHKRNRSWIERGMGRMTKRACILKISIFIRKIYFICFIRKMSRLWRKENELEKFRVEERWEQVRY